ncbi:hypothetical protein PLEOSDRAFT_1080094 [Pleurotus ostreatus PC15]|uniref:Uncharacterized protein n=1 Tax=Pleurotus ostreatus (strain PC15) TaxID=1137138 RepID=A0A067NWQ9_PLEO1|nr:hypothetical protein PLEOSDRAFT_1080094 [Pleurotus ostreatus PC15]
MAPPSKANAEQKAYLTGLLDKFLEAQKHGRLDRFWPVLYRGWFEQWQEEEDPAIMDDGERKKNLGTKIAKRQDYLKRWYHNRTAAKTRATPKQLPPPQPIKNARRPQLLQLYSKKYYKTRIRPKIYENLPAGTKLTGAAFLSLLQEKIPQIFALETAEIKKEIEDLYEALRNREDEEDKDAPPERITAARYAAAIDEIPRYFQAFSQELARRTGWSFTLLAGGPDPENGGRINSIGVHFGENEAGQHFGKATPGFGDTVLTPYANFLNTIYKCDARSLVAVDSVDSSPADTPPHGSATTMASFNAGVESRELTLPPPVPAPPAALVTPAAPPNTNAAPLPDLDEFDWSEFDATMATFNPTIPSTMSPLAGNGAFGSLLDELAADLPDYITHAATKMTSINLAPIPTVVTVPGIPATPISTAPELPILPIPPVALPSPAVASSSPPAVSSPVVLPSSPPVASSPVPAVSSPVLLPSTAAGVPTGNAENAETVGPVADVGSDVSPMIGNPAPLRRRKRALDVGEDSAFIVPGKRVRKLSERKEWEATSITKKKENRHPKKAKHPFSQTTPMMWWMIGHIDEVTR